MRRSMIVPTVIAIVLGAGGLIMASGSHVVHQKNSRQDKLARQAKVTKDQAQETALQRAPGTVESGELEREHGKLVYSFDIRNTKGTITEVQVSAISGKVVRVEYENKAQERAEKKKQSKETH